MAKGGIALDRKGNSLLLETAMHLQDLAVSAWRGEIAWICTINCARTVITTAADRQILRLLQLAMVAFRSLEQSKAGLQYVTDEVLGEFLLSLSTANLPTAVHAVVAVMSREGRHCSPQLLNYTTPAGCTFLTAWLDSRLDLLDIAGGEDGSGERKSPQKSLPLLFAPVHRCLGVRSHRLAEEPKAVDWVVIDGVRLDPATLCAINDDGEILLPNKMGVKELRAELAARQSPLRGNKKELTRLLSRARSAAEVDESLVGDSGKRDGKVKKVRFTTPRCLCIHRL
jgi:hypothetical protein